MWLLLLGCRSTSDFFKSYKPEYSNFEIQKIQANGIQPVDFQKTEEEWPKIVVGQSQPLKFKADGLKFAVIGDTGCRLVESAFGKKYQNCSSMEEWPYPVLAKSVSKEKYDFLIHTGDYHYREHCSDENLCPSYTKSLGYGWAAWWDDFYGPSQDLFKKSPILFVRGNHEDCKRAYNGWGPLSVYSKPFDLKSEQECVEIEPYQWIEMGDLIMINFDDSGFQDRAPSLPHTRKMWVDKLSEIAERIKALPNKKEIWFLTHKPVLAYVPNDKGGPKDIDDYLRDVMKDAKLTKKIDYFLSGHVHNQQIVFGKKNVLQHVIGHSGTALDPFATRIKTDKVISTTDSKYSFGYALFERKGFKKWQIIYKNDKGDKVMTCLLKDNKADCN